MSKLKEESSLKHRKAKTPEAVNEDEVMEEIEKNFSSSP